MRITLHQNSPHYDLHIHSLWSDGEDDLIKISKQAKEKGLKGFAVCDHNSFSPYIDQLISQAAKYSVKVIKGIEISSQLFLGDGSKVDFHVLGYYLGCDSQLLSKALKGTLIGYQNRAEKILQKCRRLGLPLNYKEINESNRGSYLTRNTIAEAISKATGADYKTSLKIAFIEDSENWFMDTFEAIALVKESGGIPFLAHPGKHIESLLKKSSGSRYILEKMIHKGLKGIEVFHPAHKESDTVRLHEIAINHELLVTGGTDYHGINRAPLTRIGDFGISDNNFAKLEKALKEIEIPTRRNLKFLD